MDQRVFGRAVLGIEGEVDLAAAVGGLAGGRPFQQRRNEGRHLQPGLLDGAGDGGRFLQAHAEQVAAIHRAHIEAADVVFLAEGDHVLERGADFVADDGERETREGHAG